MKVIIQVIATETDPQVATIRNTWASKVHPDCRVEFVYGVGAGGQGKNCIYGPFPESRQNIGKKTIYAIGEKLQKFESEPFDYVFRTNVSSYVDTFLLVDFLTKVGSELDIWYGGVVVYDPPSNTTFASGCGFLLSHKCCQLICDNYMDLDFSLIDDVMIGKFLAAKGISIVPLPRVDIQDACLGIVIPDAYVNNHQLPRVFHYRVKNEVNRQKDSTRLKSIHFIKRQDRSMKQPPPSKEQWQEYCHLTILSSGLYSRQKQVNVLINGSSVSDAMEAALSLDCRIRLFRDTKLAEGMDVVVGKPYSGVTRVASGVTKVASVLGDSSHRATSSDPLVTLGYFDLPKKYRVGLAGELYKAAYDTMPKVCLSMIVKNEAKCILKCLSSVVNLIDYWIISDTGSTDDTCFLIQKFMDMHRVPGKLLHDRRFESRPFHFADARNLPLFTAGALESFEYTFTLDADEELSCGSVMNLKRLLRANRESESFNVVCRTFNNEFQRTLFVNPHVGFKYTGACHEFIWRMDGSTCDNRPNMNRLIPETYGGVLCKNAGARSENPDKFLGDAQNIEADMAINGYDDRSQFYMAQCFSDHVATLKHRIVTDPTQEEKLKPIIQNYRLQAIQAFQTRVERGNAERERSTPTEYYKALISIARLRAEEFYENRVKETFEAVVNAFRAVIAFDPKRPDALLEMALFLEPIVQWNNIAFQFAKEAHSRRNETFEEYLFIEPHIRNDAAIFYAKMLKDRNDELWRTVVAEVEGDGSRCSETQRQRCKTLRSI